MQGPAPVGPGWSPRPGPDWVGSEGEGGRTDTPHEEPRALLSWSPVPVVLAGVYPVFVWTCTGSRLHTGSVPGSKTRNVPVSSEAFTDGGRYVVSRVSREERDVVLRGCVGLSYPPPQDERAGGFLV